MILEEILSEVGRNNNLSDFPAKLGFDEANTRLVNYNKASKQKEEKVRFWRSPAFRGGSSVNPSPFSLQVKPAQTPPRVTCVSPASLQVRTRMATRQQSGSYLEEEDEDMTDLQPTFSGPVIKWVT